jgi:hypothetical protein
LESSTARTRLFERSSCSSYRRHERSNREAVKRRREVASGGAAADMNCSATGNIRDASSESISKDNSIPSCAECKGQGRSVSRKTVLLMLKPHLLERAMAGSYGFCPASDCPVVYFEEQSGRSFTIGDLRVRVGVKAKTDPIPLCYCFGFEESHIREEIFETGTTTVLDKVSHLIREGLCACDTRNPAGVCCLGEVNRTVKRLGDKR